MIFNEFVFPCKNINTDAGTSRGTPEDFNLIGGAQFEVELNVGQPDLHVSIQNTKPEPVHDDHVDLVQEDQVVGEVVQEDELQLDDEHQEQPLPEEGLRNYQLSRDKERRAIRPLARYSLS